MKQLGIPYQLKEAPDELKNIHLDNITIVPASLLTQKEKYRAVTKRLSTGSVLICSPTLPKHRRILETVASFFRGHGHQVTLIPTA